MKKLFSFLFLGLLCLTLLNCKDDNDNVQDNDTYPVVLEIRNENFAYNANDGYNIYKQFSQPLYQYDMVLVYRQAGVSNGNAVWQQIPRTLYFNQEQDGFNGELDYDFDFTANDLMIYAGGTYNLATTPQYINNQTFRVVLIPASGRMANIDYSDYNAVIKYYGIDDSKIKFIK